MTLHGVWGSLGVLPASTHDALNRVKLSSSHSRHICPGIVFTCLDKKAIQMVLRLPFVPPRGEKQMQGRPCSMPQKSLQGLHSLLCREGTGRAVHMV